MWKYRNNLRRGDAKLGNTKHRASVQVIETLINPFDHIGRKFRVGNSEIQNYPHSFGKCILPVSPVRSKEASDLITTTVPNNKFNQSVKTLLGGTTTVVLVLVVPRLFQIVCD
jgi:hypothetical protein